jgi:hypothetical protein
MSDKIRQMLSNKGRAVAGQRVYFLEDEEATEYSVGIVDGFSLLSLSYYIKAEGQNDISHFIHQDRVRLSFEECVIWNKTKVK